MTITRTRSSQSYHGAVSTDTDMLYERQRDGSRPALGAAADPLPGVALERRRRLEDRIARQAVVAVRAWMLAAGRTFLVVDVAGGLGGGRHGGPAVLAAAVRRLPRQVFAAGLDIRGDYTVRLTDLSGYLERTGEGPGSAGARPAGAGKRRPAMTGRRGAALGRAK